MSNSLPTFLGIGSMRCGSTWLYKVLRCHPDIRVSDTKEVHFFFLYEMMQHDLHWYEALFSPPPPETQPKAVRGEITPGYFRLKQWQVNSIAKLLPDLRILITLRHPIDRAWSQITYTLGRLDGHNVREVHIAGFLRQLERPRTILSSDYARALKIWSNAFGREALHIGLFHELRDDPSRFIERVLRHIGASTSWRIPNDLTTEKVFATRNLVKGYREIPEVVEWYLAQRLLPSTQKLNVLLEGKVSNWVDELRAVKGRTHATWRLLAEVNRALLSLPERLAYHSYHVVEDAKLWFRWRKLVNEYRASARPSDNVFRRQPGRLHGVS